MIDRDELNLDYGRLRRLSHQAPRQESRTPCQPRHRSRQCAGTLSSPQPTNTWPTPWAFKMGGKTVQRDPRSIMISDAVFSHLAHHRGQLTVYLRLLESKVPALYGPSADEHL